MIFRKKTTLDQYFNHMLSNHKKFYDVNDSIRIYYTPREEGCGFDGEIIEITAWFGELGDWESVAEFERVGQIHAFFDGIRHLYLGEDGYIHCPVLSDWHEILNALKVLEDKYCNV